MMNRKKLDLEDLLKLKRCEIPQETFWETFDAGLQAKISSITPKRFVWENLWTVFRKFSPALASCAIALMVAVHFGCRNKTSRYDIVAMPTSISDCQTSVLVPDAAVQLLAKSVIQEKMVATTSANCFSF